MLGPKPISDSKMWWRLLAIVMSSTTFSFEVAPGETLCIMGRSGAGKSVTLKLMIRLLKPDRGKVFIQGQSIGEMDEDALSKVRRRMGFLFQSGALFSPFTLYENLAIPLARRTSKSSAEIQALVRQRLQDVGLENDGDKMPSELSGGMKKRAGLARALVLDPCILLADEPTSGLDPRDRVRDRRTAPETQGKG